MCIKCDHQCHNKHGEKAQKVFLCLEKTVIGQCCDTQRKRIAGGAKRPKKCCNIEKHKINQSCQSISISILQHFLVSWRNLLFTQPTMENIVGVQCPCSCSHRGCVRRFVRLPPGLCIAHRARAVEECPGLLSPMSAVICNTVLLLGSPQK